MVRVKHYLDIDVLTAARQRIRHLFSIFYDVVAVCFSGGKDSLVVLHLVREAAAELGRLPVPVVFRDEELIPDSVVDFVDGYRREPWVDMAWYAVPLRSNKFILGRSTEYLQWDPAREPIRPVPPWAITLPPGDARVFDQYTMEEFAAERFRGRVAFCTGIRASESLIRFRSAVNKLDQNYITGTGAKRVQLAKPIYDWEEKDVWKFLHDQQVRYCPVYDAELWAGQTLRVSTPLHSEYAKRLAVLARVDPEFYDRVLRAFPEMQVQSRYWHDLDRTALRAKYGTSYDDLERYVAEVIEDPAQQELAGRMLRQALVLAKGRPDSYPPRHLFDWLAGGSFKRLPLPLPKHRRPKS